MRARGEDRPSATLRRPARAAPRVDGQEQANGISCPSPTRRRPSRRPTRACRDHRERVAVSQSTTDPRAGLDHRVNGGRQLPDPRRCSADQLSSSRGQRTGRHPSVAWRSSFSKIPRISFLDRLLGVDFSFAMSPFFRPSTTNFDVSILRSVSRQEPASTDPPQMPSTSPQKQCRTSTPWRKKCRRLTCPHAADHVNDLLDRDLLEQVARTRRRLDGVVEISLLVADGRTSRSGHAEEDPRSVHRLDAGPLEPSERP